MNNKNKMSFTKKLTAGALVVGMLATVFVILPKQADAAIAADEVIYEEMEISNYWTADSKTAPVEEGYVFGGWFYQSDTEVSKAEKVVDGETTTYYVPLTANDLNTDEDNACDYEGKAYAKFVPAQVLSVKAQNGVGKDGNKIETADDISESNPMSLRLMTSVDSLNYDTIGFHIYLNNKSRPTDSADGDYILESSTVFEELYVGNTTQTTKANDIFGGVSEYAFIWDLNDIKHPSNATKIIYARPYWNTMDGTQVLGLAKYVHIEDEYNDYISIPINLLDGQDVAAGKVSMTYVDADAATAAAWEVKEVEVGRVLPEMNAKVSGNTIIMVGNATKADEYETDLSETRETLFANIRFQKVDGTIDNENVSFISTMEQFCDWNSNNVTIEKIWDVIHYGTETASE